MTLKALEELHRGDDLEPEGQLRDGKEARICTLGEDVKTGACFETNRLPGCREGDLLVRVRSRQMLERLQEQYIKNEIQEIHSSQPKEGYTNSNLSQRGRRSQLHGGGKYPQSGQKAASGQGNRYAVPETDRRDRFLL